MLGYRALGWVIAATALGCRPPQYSLDQALRSATAGRVGCPPREIATSDVRNTGYDAMTWTAICRGHTYYCQQEPYGQGAACAAALPRRSEAEPTAPTVTQGISLSIDPETKLERLKVTIGSRYLGVALDGVPALDPAHLRLSIARAQQSLGVLQGCEHVSLGVPGSEQPLPAQPKHADFAGDGGAWESLTLTVERAQVKAFEGESVAVRACGFALRLSEQQTALVRTFLKHWDGTPNAAAPTPAPPAAAAPEGAGE